MMLPPEETPLYNHPLPALEEWLQGLGARQEAPHSPCWELRREQWSARVELAVEDEGPGVPRALHAKVFEPFFSTKPTGQGTGLGLSICYGIVQDHGGRIELESPEGGGATFRVRLPAAGAA